MKPLDWQKNMQKQKVLELKPNQSNTHFFADYFPLSNAHWKNAKEKTVSCKYIFDHFWKWDMKI